MTEKIIKASFRGCSIEDRRTFSEAHCIMPISIGQKIHEGDKFIAAMRLVERSFRECTFLLDDSVQKYTLKMASSKDMETLHREAVDAGTAWMNRQKNILESLKISYTIMRWDDWLTMPEFPEKHSIVVDLYRTNEVYKDAIQRNIADFLGRFENRLIDYDDAENLCLTYLLEECAVMTLWVKYKYDFELYPNGRNRAMSATYDFLIKNQYPTLLKQVSLRFKKYAVRTNIDAGSEIISI